MKFAKKLLSVLLVVFMLAAMMATPAMAAEGDLTITIDNEAAGHTYAAYQIFTGTLNDKGVLSNIQWGSGIKSDAFLAALKECDDFTVDGTNLFAGAADAKSVAGVITGWGYNEANVKRFADVAAANLTATYYTSAAQADDAYTITVPAVDGVPQSGYYLIKDVGTLGVEGATDYLLQVVNSIEIAPKDSKPTFHKSVNNSNTGTFVKAMDAQIGDTVWFKLEATIPNLYNDYKQFHAEFTDILPVGLDPVEDSSNNNIYIEHADSSTTPLTAEVDSVAIDTDSNAETREGWNVSLDLGNIKTQLGGVTLNLNDKIIIKYAATVTSDAVYGLNGAKGNENKATFTFSNDMNEEPSSEHDHSTASLESSASVYVYQAVFTKVDSVTKAPLQGAEFYLYRNVGSPAVKTYAHTDANGVITKWDDDVPENKLVSGADGKFVVKGLDALTYHLEEIKAPDGYNDMTEAVQATITSTITDQTLTAVSMSVDGASKNGTADDGKVIGDINNTAGTTLPSTGGMGTAIFYIVGAALLLGSTVAFLVKKRNEA